MGDVWCYATQVLQHSLPKIDGYWKISVSKSILKSLAFIVEYTATKFQHGQEII